MKKSIWQNIKTTTNTTNKNIETNTLIIGGGITGLTTLINTENAILIEANKIGNNTTGKSTAKISVMQEYNYQKIQNILGKSKTQKYLKSQIEAQKYLIKIIKENNIDCDLEKNKSYLFTNIEENIDKIVKEKEILDKQIKTKVINKLPNNYPCIYGIETEEYVFNPIKYMLQIKELFKDNIYENTRALKIEKKLDYYLVKTNKNKIKAQNIIICTHFPFQIKKYILPLKLNIECVYIISARTTQKNINMISDDQELTSIRYYKNNIIYAGFKRKLYNTKNHNYYINNLIKKFKNHFNLNITNTWYNYDITSNDYLPIISKIKKENIYFATAFNKWGMTNGALSSIIITDLLNNKQNEYTELFSYYRKTNIKKILKSITYTYYNLMSLLNNKQKNIKTQNTCGKKYSIYIDENNNKHQIINKCPHMGCRVIFNEIDKTWDCPCHGSRYNIDGKVIKGPSVENLKK